MAQALDRHNWLDVDLTDEQHDLDPLNTIPHKGDEPVYWAGRGTGDEMF